MTLSKGKPALKSHPLSLMERARLYLGSPAADKLPKDATEGRVLAGKVDWGKGLGSEDLTFTVPPAAKKPDAGSSDAKADDDKTKEDLLEVSRAGMTPGAQCAALRGQRETSRCEVCWRIPSVCPSPVSGTS